MLPKTLGHTHHGWLLLEPEKRRCWSESFLKSLKTSISFFIWLHLTVFDFLFDNALLLFFCLMWLFCTFFQQGNQTCIRCRLSFWSLSFPTYRTLHCDKVEKSYRTFAINSRHFIGVKSSHRNICVRLHLRCYRHTEAQYPKV